MEQLFNDGNGFLRLLPDLITHLYVPTPLADSVLSYIDNQLQVLNDEFSSTKAQLQTIKEDLTSLQSSGTIPNPQQTTRIDEDRSLTLSLVFGDIFTDAMEILSNRENIHFYTAHQPTHLDNEEFGNPQSMVVVYETKGPKLNSSLSKHARIELISKVIELEITDLLGELGLKFSSSRLLDTPVAPQITEEKKDAVEKLKANPKAQTTRFYVDLPNWYCSCDKLQSCYTKDWLSQSQPKFTYQQTTETHEVFQGINFDSLDPPAICPHILAALIIRVNPNANLCKQVSLANFSSIID
ncbi:hypothetical protein PSN45_000364 [Yamadazyma tenuis]|uniref:Uncharacterized protein n=1 Tax=Candida tenuis (strain ATCC 10573 / BCRC 21748 / CBS 615 / JCM 9827 / NBRC 10315 / NRRL Y-1498 / VKM Y-70) TaxID=590646 RepID=G3B7X6_CANTC|nr:uncharacterized protein CANTEDRAFT_94564 [Yamadazyma tenuis ATCC 10573]EGV61679.1 hypothetical protein CANTEDRAFT_94564 [Yamadazyma tenuis ATCC 10573]WEJ92906.1 hypothetical protein PSN45_000364 [Yamadazyma tenuis]